jgi:hypothetical protein
VKRIFTETGAVTIEDAQKAAQSAGSADEAVGDE